jgi:rSAM/selenodomain-associated transferase 2
LPDPCTVSIVLPVFRDSNALARTLAASDFRGPIVREVIVAATREDSESLARLRAERQDIRWIDAPRGRARQMNAGAAVASGQWLIFLHADTRLPDNWRDAIAAADDDPRVSIGCFRFALDSSSPFARVIEFGVRLRVALFALPYGDQALFVRRDLFHEIGGYADIPIMEDVDLVQRLRKRGRLYCAVNPAVTSARRWEQDGWIRRTAKHMRLITLYLLGVTPDRLSASL